MNKVKTEKTAIIGCIHTPYEDKAALAATMDFLKWWKPKNVIVNGDAYDLLPLMTHKNRSREALDLQDEIDAGRDFNNKLRKAVGPSADIVLHQGNHEARWDNYLQDIAPAFTGVGDCNLETVFRLEDSKIRYVRGNTGSYAKTAIGNVLVGHFPIIRADAAATAKSLVLRYFNSVIAHHSHRMGTYEKATPSGRFMGQEGGCLCTLSPTYVDWPDWSQGFVTLEKEVYKDLYHINPIRVINGKILYDGRHFS